MRSDGIGLLTRKFVGAATGLGIALIQQVIDDGRHDARPSTVAAFATRCREASPDLKPRDPDRASLSPRAATRPHASPHEHADIVGAEAEPTTFMPVMPVIDDEAVSFEPVDFGYGNGNGTNGAHVTHVTPVTPVPTTASSSALESQEAPGEPRPSVIAFLNACALCGLLSDAPVEAPAPSVGHLAREGRSLGGLMQRLRGALGIGRA